MTSIISLIDHPKNKKYRAIIPETKFMHFMGEIEGVQLRFLLTRLKCEIITISGVYQSNISIKRCKLFPKLYKTAYNSI